MTELEKIEYAKMFIDKLANGINPLYDVPLEENDVANHVRMSRCFFFISDILNRVIQNGGVEPTKSGRKKRAAFSLSVDMRQKISVSEIPLSMKEIASSLNSLIDVNTTKKIWSGTIERWLLEMGLLELVVRPDGKRMKWPTAAGRELGILTEERLGPYGPYVAVLYDQNAQMVIFEHIDDILSLKRGKREDSLKEFHMRPWTVAQDEKLVQLLQNGMTVSDIAFDMKRTESGIRTRLELLGVQERTFYSMDNVDMESEDA